MSDIVEKKPETPKPPISSGGLLAALVPKNLDEAFRLAQGLSRAGDMVPQHFQGKPEPLMAAILRGMEVGLLPMQAISHIAVINGRACLWGDALPAIIQRHGHHIDVHIEGAGDDETAIATLTRGDTGAKITRKFSIADAKKAGLFAKKGPWQSYPSRMLTHRARAWAIRDGAADALMGLQVAEEVSDYQPMRDVTPKESGFAALANKAREQAEEQEETKEDAGTSTAELQDREPDTEEAEAEPKDSAEDSVKDDAKAVNDTETEDKGRPEEGGGEDEGKGDDQEEPALDLAALNLDSSFPGADEYTEGVEAFQNGKPMTDCPYQDPSKATDWCGGWQQASEAAK